MTYYSLNLQRVNEELTITNVSDSLKDVIPNAPKLPIGVHHEFIQKYGISHKLEDIYNQLIKSRSKIVRIDYMTLSKKHQKEHIEYALIGEPVSDKEYELNIFILNTANRYLVSKIVHIENVINQVKQDLVKETIRTNELFKDMYNGKDSYSVRVNIQEGELKFINTAIQNLQSFDEKLMQVSSTNDKLTYSVEELMRKVDSITLGKLFKNLSWKQLLALASLLLTVSTFGSSISSVLKRQAPNLPHILIELFTPE